MWGALTVLVIVGTYVASGSTWYCARTCHAEDKHVTLAAANLHASCIACHESNPVSGVIGRVRMAVSTKPVPGPSAEVLVESSLCMRCHRSVSDGVIETNSGVRVSHEAINAGGRVCGDCHAAVGHRKGRSFEGGMAQCTGCHDGKQASRACTNCHRDGSPLLAASVSKADSAFDYPAIRVANRDCARCHGAEKKCITCHNGLVLPHPADFVNGGHARQAAFGGKEQCYKCHSLGWCGNGRCHNAFAAHNEQTWPREHRTGTSSKCGSCHQSWDGKTDFCKQCH